MSYLGGGLSYTGGGLSRMTGGAGGAPPCLDLAVDGADEDFLKVACKAIISTLDTCEELKKKSNF